MTYDKKSFLAGIAVGRQLKGWNLYPQEASIVGWTANPGWVWRQPGLIGHINPGTSITFQDLGISTSGYGTIDGNRVYDFGGQTPRRFGTNYYQSGDIVLWDITVNDITRIEQTSLGVGYYFGGGYHDPVPIIGTGVWITGSNGASCRQLGRGTIKLDRHQAILFSTGLAGTYADMYINAIYVNEHCIMPGGDSLWKKTAGPSIVCIARYINADGIQITTPVLISDRQTAVEWSFFQGGMAQEVYTTQQEFHGNLYYMGTAGDLLTGSASSSTGTQILDLTAGSRITTSTELFLAVAAASGLSTL